MKTICGLSLALAGALSVATAQSAEDPLKTLRKDNPRLIALDSDLERVRAPDRAGRAQRRSAGRSALGYGACATPEGSQAGGMVA
jgi:hypothetical protein